MVVIWIKRVKTLTSLHTYRCTDTRTHTQIVTSPETVFLLDNFANIESMAPTRQFRVRLQAVVFSLWRKTEMEDLKVGEVKVSLFL